MPQPELTTYLIRQLQQITNPDDLLGKVLEVEGGTVENPTSHFATLGTLLQAVYKNAPGANSTKTLLKAVRCYAPDTPEYNPGDSTLTGLEEDYLALGCLCYVEFPLPSRTYRLRYDSTGPLRVYLDGRFTGPRQPARWFEEAQSTGGTADKFDAPFTFSLDPGETIGKYHDGMTAPWTGLTAVQALKDAGVKTKFPTYSIAAIGVAQSAPADGEVGESVSNIITGTYNHNDAGLETGVRLYRGAQVLIGSQTTSPITRTVQMVRTLSPIPIYAVADYAAGAKKNITPGNTPDTRPAQVRNPNAPQAAEIGFQSGVIYLNGYERVFFGPTSSTPTSSAQVRALPQNQLSNQGNAGTLNTGTTAIQFAIVPPTGKTLQSVTDLDNQNANITLAYALQGTVGVADAGGNVSQRPLYLYTAATPYPFSARHYFTYA